ncbi:MAG: hypothetical protein U5L11_10715 [Arhodomonas sp.]|nr:hypothetical protein [Arhodomonas sp.]
MTLPDWDHRGVLPPFFGEPTGTTGRSPSSVKLRDLVQRFGVSPERRRILQGLLDYRAALHAIGITSGFQWVDGSFAEYVEGLEQRPPNDVDVVTFFEIPAGENQGTLARNHGNLFQPSQVKQRFRVDGYPVPWDGSDCAAMLERAIYWYSLWSHRRDLSWKGFVQIPLDPDEADAQGFLDRLGAPAGEEGEG